MDTHKQKTIIGLILGCKWRDDYCNSSSSVRAKDEPYIGLTEENSIEFLSTICLSYIHFANSPCYTKY